MFVFNKVQVNIRVVQYSQMTIIQNVSVCDVYFDMRVAV